MTDPLIEIARKIAADVWDLDAPNRQAVINGEFDHIRQVQSALTALRAQQAMIVEWLEVTGFGDDEVDQASMVLAVQIKTFAYLKGRG